MTGVQTCALPISTSNRRYLFLDEASFLPEWPRGIKVLIDMGFDRNATYVVTGSSALDLKRSSEKLPGRRGKGCDFVLLPLSFRQFLSISYPQIKLATVNLISEFLEKKEADLDRKSTRLNSSHIPLSRMPSSA